MLTYADVRSSMLTYAGAGEAAGLRIRCTYMLFSGGFMTFWVCCWDAVGEHIGAHADIGPLADIAAHCLLFFSVPATLRRLSFGYRP